MTVTRPTERPNERTADIDLLSVAERLGLLIAEDVRAVEAVQEVTIDLGRVVSEAVRRMASGGRLHYFGAGASGRLAVLDATELTPTFGLPREQAVAHFPGGSAALVDATIDREDDDELGERDADGVSDADIVVGLTASGTTAYVGGALRSARSHGACTALITCNPASPLVLHSDHVIVLDTGPEALTGSTRLKAGTATKVALNAFSTAVMIGLGRTYSNLMIGMSVTNEKLRERAVSVLTEATGRTRSECRQALDDADRDIPRALVALLGGVDPAVAGRALASEGGVRAALAALTRGAQ